MSDVREIPYVPCPTEFSAPVRYAHGPDSYPQSCVPRGAISAHVWSASRVFPGTNRRYWVYVPAQYTASEPASLMVFQDGHIYLDPEGEMRVPVVFDNLIHRGEMPSPSVSSSTPASQTIGMRNTTPSAMPTRRSSSAQASATTARMSPDRARPYRSDRSRRGIHHRKVPGCDQLPKAVVLAHCRVLARRRGVYPPGLPHCRPRRKASTPGMLSA